MTPMFRRKVEERLIWLRVLGTTLDGDFDGSPSSSSLAFTATICAYIE
jgi:hypothetical protein